MNLFRRHRRVIAAAGIPLVYVVVSLASHPGAPLTAFSDIFVLLLMLGCGAIMLANAFSGPRLARRFWLLMALGFFLRGLNQGAWVYREVILHLDIPDPYFWDIILFFHVIPIMAAVGWRPDLTRNESRFQLSALNFLMLLVW